MKGDWPAAAPKPEAWNTQQASWRPCREGAVGRSSIGLDALLMQIASIRGPFDGAAQAALVIRPCRISI